MNVNPFQDREYVSSCYVLTTAKNQCQEHKVILGISTFTRGQKPYFWQALDHVLDQVYLITIFCQASCQAFVPSTYFAKSFAIYLAKYGQVWHQVFFKIMESIPNNIAQIDFNPSIHAFH